MSNKNKVRCRDCIFKFECLAKHHIPKNYGKDCKKYEKQNGGIKKW